MHPGPGTASGLFGWAPARRRPLPIQAASGVRGPEIAFVGLQGFEASLQGIEGLRSNEQAPIGSQVPCSDTPPGFIVGAFYPIEKDICPQVLNQMPDGVPFGASPEPIIQHHIKTQAKATHPYRLHHTDDSSEPVLKGGCGWIFAEQACHPFIRRKAHGTMAELELPGQGRLPRADIADEKVCRCHGRRLYQRRFRLPPSLTAFPPGADGRAGGPE